MRSLFSRNARHPTTPLPPSFSGGGGGGETPPRRRTPKENVDPVSYSSPAHHHHSANDHAASPFRSPSPAAKPLSARNRLPPRPPSLNPLKRKLDVSSAAAAGPAHDAASAPDSGVQVVVRIRPPCRMEEEEAGEDGQETEACVRKTAVNSVAIQGQDFTFDAVADAISTQDDIFNLVGLPLVENCLSGFNSSIFAYGQTGSGKTYTMWGPLSALSEDSISSERGLTPRVFEQLFSRIKEEQVKHADTELTYSCICSFLEIYNEQITDLLDPSQKNLQIREDVRTACVYVESLTKQFVFTMKDVTQLLVKGLANRRTGATSVNADSSRSHCVFTCAIKCESKNPEDGSSSTRSSRINLVDLAGSERQKLTHAAGDRLKEAGNINRSLSQLGNLINILAEISQSGKQRHHVPYRDSKLTFLLQESLGGNAKLAMICAVSPSQSCKSETLSTLRFAQRAKAIKNNAIVNEEKVEDVNALREQIRQLKDELHRMKSNGSLEGNNGSFSTGWNARRSLHLLKMSLGRPSTFQTIKEDSDEEMEIDENDVEKPYNHENMVMSPTGGKEYKGLLQASTEIRTGPSHVDALDGDKNLVSTKRSCSVANKFSSGTDGGDGRCKLNLAASIQRGLQVIESHQNNGAWRRASVGLNARIMDVQPCKVDVAIQTDPEESEARDNPLALIPSCLHEASANESRDPNSCRDLQLVPADGAVPSDEQKQQHVLKAVEKVLAGAIRREMARDEQCVKQAAEIQQLNRLVQQYKHERECNAVIAQTLEGKIARLESLMDGTLPTEEFMNEEYLSLVNEHKILKMKYENHPELLRVEIELKRLQEELGIVRNCVDEKEVLQEEIQDLKNHMHYMLSSSSSIRRLRFPLRLSQGTTSPGTKDKDVDTNVGDAPDWTEAESKWITLTEELRVELEANKSLVGRLQSELDSEKKCSDELKEVIQTAMQAHARILDQYAELQEKHISLLALHRRIREDVDDVKMRAAKAGVKGAELRFINSLSAEISVLRAGNEGLQGQLRDTAEAVQAAGELLVRLKDAEEAEKLAKRRALLAEQETEKAYQEIDNLKKNYDQEIVALNQRLSELSQHTDAVQPAEPIDLEPARYDTAGSPGDQQWREEEFSTLQQGRSFEVSKSTDLNSWFYGYDKCNI
ncbi:kinesin-like protein KIN-12A [Phragmites australis]|uniref:kinesin-like protein KIN-12A n=1 Tax=Phragmites australis TaxID=29695 RepID=UPI002D797CA5|nr:kinesin-like protein KIN-12A [Phragmites australis]